MNTLKADIITSIDLSDNESHILEVMLVDNNRILSMDNDSIAATLLEKGLVHHNPIIGKKLDGWYLTPVGALVRENLIKAKEDIFEKSFIESLGFIVVKDDGQYGRAETKNDKRILQWNRDGNWFGIREDADTRNAFNGRVYTRDQIRLVNQLVY